MRFEQSYYAENDYYELMGLTPEASSIQVVEAFEHQSSDLNLNHPDQKERVRSAEKMLGLTQAYEVLNDPIQRSHYDLRQLGRKNLPISNQVDGLFKEAVKAFRQHQIEMALRYFKEISMLYPHRPLYRVHLAIAYAEKNWMSFAESELETALRLDPQYMFAKETVAHLLFKLPDKKHPGGGNPLNRQVGALAAAFVGLSVLLASGLPQQLIGGVFGKLNHATQEIFDPMKEAARKAGKKIHDEKDINSQLPQDMVQDLQQKQDAKSTQAVQIPDLGSDFKPEGQTYDYRKQKAKSKVYYPDQGVVVVTYEDGSILTYKPSELKGWKQDTETNQAVMVTRDNELIPAPATVPLKMPDGSAVDLNSAAFPAHLFPEYATAANAKGAQNSGSSTTGAVSAPVGTAQTQSGTQPGSQPGTQPANQPGTQPATQSATQGKGQPYSPYGAGR
ncbi:MAG: DnaJ domain-containing protein [Candidatus Sericytochromatia bacterium]|nr:DnaJ domain-containing protein [Candidatus Sericytochromatia bacterium]